MGVFKNDSCVLQFDKKEKLKFTFCDPTMKREQAKIFGMPVIQPVIHLIQPTVQEQRSLVVQVLNWALGPCSHHTTNYSQSGQNTPQVLKQSGTIKSGLKSVQCLPMFTPSYAVIISIFTSCLKMLPAIGNSHWSSRDNSDISLLFLSVCNTARLVHTQPELPQIKKFLYLLYDRWKMR